MAVAVDPVAVTSAGNACHTSAILPSAASVIVKMRGAGTTAIVKVFASLRGGEPSSVTRIVTVLVAGENPLGGIQAKTPLVALMVAPAGAPGSRVNVNELAGMSASVAMAVKVSRLPSFTVLSLMGAKTGALFTSLTMMVKLLVSLSGRLPSSVTRTVMTLVLGPCASVGVQVRTPVTESSVIPLGAATRVNVNELAGISGSVAELVTVKVVSSSIV